MFTANGLTTADVVKNNKSKRASLHNPAGFDASKDANAIANAAKANAKKSEAEKKVYGFDKKLLTNSYLLHINTLYPELKLLRSDALQPEWSYVRADFELATEQYEARQQGASTKRHQPELTEITQDILKIRQEILNDKNEIICREKQSQAHDLLLKNAEAKSKHTRTQLKMQTNIRAEDPHIFDGEPSDHCESMKFREKQMAKKHQEEMTSLKKSIEKLQQKLSEADSQMTDKQKVVMKSYIAKVQGHNAQGHNAQDTEGTSEKEMSLINVASKNSSEVLYEIQELMRRDVESRQQERLVLQRAEENLAAVQAEGAKQATELHHKEQLVNTCEEEKKKMDEMNQRLNEKEEENQQMINYCATYQSQVEDIQVAIQHEIRMKELSTLNPVSMLDFYAKRLTGAEDSAAAVITKIRKADKKQAKAVKQHLKKQNAAKNAEQQRQQRNDLVQLK